MSDMIHEDADDCVLCITLYHVPILKLFAIKSLIKSYGGNAKLNTYMQPMIQRVVNHVVSIERGMRTKLNLNHVKSSIQKESEIQYLIEYDYHLLDTNNETIHPTEKEFQQIRDYLQFDALSIQKAIAAELLLNA